MLAATMSGAVVLIAAVPEPDHAQVLDQQKVRRNLRHLARGKADGQKPPVRLVARRAASKAGPPTAS
jgi:hypothetical protein